MNAFFNNKTGALAYLLGVSIGFAVVGEASLTVFPKLRIILLSVATLSILLYHLRGKVDFTTLITLCIMSFFYIYAMINTVLSGLNVYPIISILQSFIVTIAGVHFLNVGTKNNKDELLPIGFTILSILVVIFFLAVRELNFAGGPHFAYEIETDQGIQVRYSQGTSAFFGTAALCSILALPRNIGFGQAFLTAMFLAFTFLAFIGGGRGEIIFLIITLFFVPIVNPNSRRIFWFVIIVFILCITIFADAINVMQFTSSLRFLQFFENFDFGQRDVLFLQSINLLLGDARCFTVGCGYGYFQDYYDYRSSFYPHNIVLEGMIVWGVPGFSLLLLAAIYGWLRTSKFHMLSIVGLFFFFIGMKSGNVIDSWLALSFLFFFAGVGLSNLIQGRVSSRRPN